MRGWADEVPQPRHDELRRPAGGCVGVCVCVQQACACVQQVRVCVWARALWRCRSPCAPGAAGARRLGAVSSPPRETARVRAHLPPAAVV